MQKGQQDENLNSQLLKRHFKNNIQSQKNFCKINKTPRLKY